VPSVVDGKLLDRLDRVIKRHNLHAGRGIVEPVSLDRAMEGFWQEFRALPEGVEAVTVRLRKGGREIVQIAYHERLGRPERSAQLRWAKGHEYGHVVGRHDGDMWVLRRFDLEGEKEDTGAHRYRRFKEWLRGLQERECEWVAAYLLVPHSALWEMRGMEGWHVARVLDVPEHLVKKRWEIWRQWGR
jgi:hypothetical protein